MTILFRSGLTGIIGQTAFHILLIIKTILSPNNQKFKKRTAPSDSHLPIYHKHLAFRGE